MNQKNLLFTLLLVSAIPFISLEGGLWDSFKNTFSAQEKNKSPTIKVLIAHDVDAAMMEVKGRYNIYDPYKNKKIASRFIGKSNLVQPLHAGLKWGEEFPDIYQIAIIPGDSNVTILVDGIEYQGTIYVYNIGGAISIVNEVEIEDYLSSVLETKLDTSLSPEALAAAVISARTDAYYKVLLAKTNPYWDVEAKQAGYQGCAISRDKELNNSLISTKYMVLSRTGLYEGEIIPFPVEIVSHRGSVPTRKSDLPLDQVEALATNGEHAAKILSKIFPKTTIRLTHTLETPETGIVKK